jgi:hypothetical protein
MANQERVTRMKNAQMNELEGIRFVVDASGDKVAVLIDLKQYGELWEDFYDTILARQRADEPRESLETVRESLRQSGKLGA